MVARWRPRTRACASSAPADSRAITLYHSIVYYVKLFDIPTGYMLLLYPINVIILGIGGTCEPCEHPYMQDTNRTRCTEQLYDPYFYFLYPRCFSHPMCREHFDHIPSLHNGHTCIYIYIYIYTHTHTVLPLFV